MLNLVNVIRSEESADVNRQALVAWLARQPAAPNTPDIVRRRPRDTSAAFMFLRAYEEQAAAHWQDWLRLVAAMESIEPMSQVAEADVPHLVALVVNGHPFVDPRLLRARALRLQLLPATAPKARTVLQDPYQMAAALRTIADMVGTHGRL